MTRQRCPLPPAGWRCTRDWPHDGPCAAVVEPTEDEANAAVFLMVVVLVAMMIGALYSPTFALVIGGLIALVGVGFVVRAVWIVAGYFRRRLP